MKISFSGAELFISYLDEKATLDEVIEHESYKAVFSHGEHFNNRLTKQDIENALKGQSTPFYGLENLFENLPRIKNLVKKIEKNQLQQLKDVSEVFSSLLPEEDLTTITIYPIIGYDAGIGLEGGQADYKAVEESEKYDGISIIVTVADIPPERVVQKHFKRDVIEKPFYSLETIYTVNLTDKKTHLSTTRTVPLTEKQKKIYRALNLLS